MKVGFIGLGHMGAGMATSLLRAGHDTTVYNRAPSKVQALVEQGAHAAARVADACRGDAVVTMLADDGAVEAVVFGEKGVIEALGEAMAFVGKAGVDRHRYLEILTSTLFTAPMYKMYGGLIAEQRFEPAGFAAPLGHKDIRLTLAAAETLRVPMPFASVLHDRFLTLLAQGGEALDWSAIGGLAARDAGPGAPPSGQQMRESRSASR